MQLEGHLGSQKGTLTAYYGLEGTVQGVRGERIGG